MTANAYDYECPVCDHEMPRVQQNNRLWHAAHCVAHDGQVHVDDDHECGGVDDDGRTCASCASAAQRDYTPPDGDTIGAIARDAAADDVRSHAWVYARRIRALVDAMIAANESRDAAPASDTARAITRECDELRDMLLAKNRAYGDSALNPVRIFSHASAEEQILVRIDDKLSRLARGSDAGEDVVHDLLGYLVLLRIARARAAAKGGDE